MNKKCSLCGEVLPDCCINDVEVAYKVNKQTVLILKRKLCGRCQNTTVQKLASADFLQTRRSSAVDVRK